MAESGPQYGVGSSENDRRQASGRAALQAGWAKASRPGFSGGRRRWPAGWAGTVSRQQSLPSRSGAGPSADRNRRRAASPVPGACPGSDVVPRSMTGARGAERRSPRQVAGRERDDEGQKAQHQGQLVCRDHVAVPPRGHAATIEAGHGASYQAAANDLRPSSKYTTNSGNELLVTGFRYSLGADTRDRASPGQRPGVIQGSQSYVLHPHHRRCHHRRHAHVPPPPPLEPAPAAHRHRSRKAGRWSAHAHLDPAHQLRRCLGQQLIIFSGPGTSHSKSEPFHNSSAVGNASCTVGPITRSPM